MLMCGRWTLFLRALIFLLLAVTSSRPMAAAPRETGTRLGTVRLATPETSASARAFVFLVSDAGGWGPALDTAADRLAARGLLVAGVDLPRWIAALAIGNDDCLDLVRDLEQAAKRLQRELAVAGYLSPVVAGVGAGGTLAYATLAQSPAATLAGAVSLDPTPALSTPEPFCAGAPATAVGAGAWAYGRTDALPGWWRVALRGEQDPFPWAAEIDGAAAVALPAGLSLGDALERVLVAAVEEHLAPDDGPLADLPLIELPAAGRPEMLAIVLSGDGGWRDLDKSVAQTLAAKGVGVVGLDSLRYFWSARTPEGVAADIVRIDQRYVDAWGAAPLLLIGYSFGADVLPATVNRLPTAITQRLVQLSLLGLSASADFEFHVSGWFGGGDSDALPVAPEVARLDLGRVQCFYGEEESDSLCPDPVFDGAERVRTAGGHHFDGDYEALAARILAGAERRRLEPQR